MGCEINLLNRRSGLHLNQSPVSKFPDSPRRYSIALTTKVWYARSPLAYLISSVSIQPLHQLELLKHVSTDIIASASKNMLKMYAQKQSSPRTPPMYCESHLYKSLHGSPKHTSWGEDQSTKSTPPEPPNLVSTVTQCTPKSSSINSIPLVDPLAASEELESDIPASIHPLSSSAHVSTLTRSSPTPTTTKRQPSQALPVSSAATCQDLNFKRVKSDSTLVKTLPPKYEQCPVEDLVILISDMIQELIQTNDNLPLRSGVLTRFHSRTPPSISVLNYLLRLARHATLTPPLLLSMVYYIDLLCLLYPAFTVNSLTVHRFVITACTVAAKGLSDSFWSNATYARVGGIKNAELGLLELDFLYRLDWKIVPKPEALVNYYHGLVARTPCYELRDDAICAGNDAEDDCENRDLMDEQTVSEKDNNPN